MPRGDLFPKPPRKPPRILMHVCDGGHDSVELGCGKCGYRERSVACPKRTGSVTRI